MASPSDYKSIIDNGRKAFNATMRDMECALIGYKNEAIGLRRELARERMRNSELEARIKELADAVPKERQE